MANAANAETMAIFAEIQAAYPGRFRFTSGWRSAAHNASVNGVANSYHLTGQAADFVPVDNRFLDSEMDGIRDIVGRYCYKVLKHNAGSGLHYHIEPVSRIGNCENSPAGTSPSQSNALLYGMAAVLIFLLLEG